MISKKLDIFVLILLPLIASLFVIFFYLNGLISILLFLGAPCLYIVLRNPRIFKKSFIFAFVFSIPLSVFVDALAAFDGGWHVPESVLPYRLFGVATLEVYLFGLFWVLSAILFYAYFFDKEGALTSFPVKYRKLLYLFFGLVIGVIALYNIKPSLLIIPYFYTWVSIVFVLPPLVWFLARQPQFLNKFIAQGAYFFFLLLIFELTALETGLWSFPGEHFIGWINFFGYTFPFEELVFWMIFSTPSLLAYYQYFAVDG